MENLNQTLFALLNAPEQPNVPALRAAIFFAEYAIWILPIIIGISWLKGNPPFRKLLLESTTSGQVGLLVAQIIGLVWSHPRPFLIGVGHTFISHVGLCLPLIAWQAIATSAFFSH